MLAAVLVAAVSFVFANRTPPPDKAWEELVGSEHEPLLNLPSIVKTVSLEVGSKPRVAVTVRNSGGTTLRFQGNGAKRVGQFWEIWRSGMWTSWAWCTKDLEYRYLKPDDSVEFEFTYIDETDRERVFSYFEEAGTNRAGLVLLATELPLQ
jgi:hypothetical protein